MSHRRITLSIVVSLLAAAQSGVAMAKTYKWIDAHGGIHYTQVPPVDKNAKVVEVTGDDGPADSSKSEPDAKPEKREADQPNQYRVLVPEQPDPEAQRKAEAEREKQRQEACEALRNNLQILERNTRIRIRQDDSGEPRVLTQEEREARIRQYSENIDKMCK